MSKHSGNRLKSSVVIAKLLDSEGFSDHVANMVERYWMKNVCRPGGRKKYRNLDKEMSELCLKLTAGEKLILGKFIATHKRMSFDTGLRIGLTAFATKDPRDYELPTAESASLAEERETQEGMRCHKPAHD